MAQQPRILYYSSQFPNPRSPSMGVFSLRRVQALRDAGCEVLAVSPILMTPPPQMARKPGQGWAWIRKQRQIPENTVYQGVPVLYPKWVCPPKKVFGWFASLFQFWQARSAVLPLTKEFRPDVIVASWLPDAVAAVKLGGEVGLPVLAIADGTDVNAYPELYRGWKYARDLLNEKLDNLVFVSEALCRTGSARGLRGKKNMVLRNAVDVHLFRPAEKARGADPFTVLGIGRLVPLKGLHDLLPAFAEFRLLAGRPARLVIVGDGPEREALMRQADALGIAPAVEVLAPMQQEELVKVYQSAAVFCLPSYSEGFPCVVVEAMACGKPVIATRVGGVAEVVDETSGLLVQPGDQNGLRDALAQSAARTWDAEQIRQKIVDQYAWETWADKMIAAVRMEIA